MTAIELLGQNSARFVTLAGGLALFMLFTLVVLLALTLVIFRPWLKAFLGRAEISLLNIIGMRLRRSNVDEIISCRIMSVQAGHPIPVDDIERAFIAGCDLKKLGMAYIECEKTGQQLSFEDLVDADRKDQLEKLIKS